MFKQHDSSIDTNDRSVATSGKGIRSGGAVDVLAFALGLGVTALGAIQFVMPTGARHITGMGIGTASEVLALQWVFFGATLATGGVLRLRAVSIFATEFVVIGAVAAFAVVFLRDPEAVALLVHGTIAVLAIGCSGFARLTDKAEMKRELLLARARLSGPGERIATSVVDTGEHAA